MGMAAGNELNSVTKNQSDDANPKEKQPQTSRSGTVVNPIRESKSDSNNDEGRVVHFDRTDSSRIKALEDQLAHYRGMLDKMVQQRTEILERRLSIMESCNSSLGENYHKMHQMYLDLLMMTQTNETEMHLRMSEG
jgi:hypothetical protein